MQTRVLKLKLQRPNRGKEERLLSLQEQFTEATRFHLREAVSLGTTSATKLHRACYRKGRSLFPLPASTLQQARDKALSVYRGYLTRKRQGKRASLPTFRRKLPVRMAAENLRLFPEKKVLRVTTPGGFLWLPLVIPPHLLGSLSLLHGVSEIVKEGGDWYLLWTQKSEDVPALPGPLFGLDLGLCYLAVLYGPGVVKFFSGKHLRAIREHYARLRTALQKKGKIGKIKRTKGMESRWVRDMNHKLSRQIIDLVAAHGGVLCVESLLGIRDRVKLTKKVRRMLHAWPFAQLLSFLKYKAARAGVMVIEVDPRHTSQRCSKCGHTEKGNRPTQALFRCKSCGYEVHADLNAARNIAAKGASSLGLADVTSAQSGEVESRSAALHDNHNLNASSLGSRLL